MKLKQDYYLQPDVVTLAKDLIGKVLFTNLEGKLSSGIICETEAYNGFQDKASHAYMGKRTPRNECMYSIGGKGYVYFCYGIHALFNVVTNKKNIPHAILIRGVKPLQGIEFMLQRRGKLAADKALSSGPGSMSKAMGINIKHNGISLLGDKIWLEDNNIKIPENLIQVSPRIGVEYAAEAAVYPYRFVVDHKLI